jgi:hypothetical protein
VGNEEGMELRTQIDDTHYGVGGVLDFLERTFAFHRLAARQGILDGPTVVTGWLAGERNELRAQPAPRKYHLKLIAAVTGDPTIIHLWTCTLGWNFLG